MTSSATTGLFLAVVVAGVLAGALIFDSQLAGPSYTSTSTTSSTVSTTTISITHTSSSGGGGANSNNLRLDLGVSVYSNGSLQVKLDEFNPLATPNNVTKSDSWPIQSLSTGSCPNGFYPFGISMMKGAYTVDNVSQGTPIQVFADKPCPLFLRLITAYYFSPLSDRAVVLPSTQLNQTMPIALNMTLNGEYVPGNYTGNPTPKPFIPGQYTIAAGDEWGTLVVVHITIVGGGGGSSGSSSTSSTTTQQQNGMLLANITVGPTAPVCRVNSTTGPAPPQYSNNSLVIMSSSSGRNLTTLPLNWLSNGCDAWASGQVSLAPGSYQLELSRCPYMGCATALPRGFTIVPGQTTMVNVSIDTGIR